MKTKKIVAIVLALVIVIGLAACGAKKPGKDDGKKTGDVRSISVCSFRIPVAIIIDTAVCPLSTEYRE